jgi:hypothetical protein
LTVAGMTNSLRSVNRPKFNGKETVYGRVAEPKSDEMGMQIARGVYPEVPAESVVRATAQPCGRSVPGGSAPAGEPDRRRASTARARAPGAGDAAQVRGGAGGGVFAGDERHSHCADVWGAAAEFSGGPLLGAGVVCVARGLRRRGSATLHSDPGGGGATVRATRGVQEEEVIARLEGSGFDHVSHLGWLMKA